MSTTEDQIEDQTDTQSNSPRQQLRFQPWTITWSGYTFTDEDVTASNAVAIQMLVGSGWDCLDPFAGPAQLTAIMAVMLAEATDTTPVVTLKALDDVPLADIMAAITIRED